MALSSIEEALAQLRQGGMVVVVDDEDRENEGDLIMPAQDVTADSMAFFLEYTSGVFCVPIESARADALDLPLMVVANTEAQRTASTVTVDYRHGTSTGISTSDRAATIRALIDPDGGSASSMSAMADFVKDGSVGTDQLTRTASSPAFQLLQEVLQGRNRSDCILFYH